MRKRSGKPSLLLIILLILNIFAVTGLAASYAASWINPATNWLFAFFGLLYPVLLGANLLFVLIWLILWKRFVFISLVAILAGFGHLRSLWPLRIPEPPAGGKQPLKVMTYNVHRLFGTDGGYSTHQTRQEVIDFVAQHQPDIVCFQEFYAQGKGYRQILDDFSKQTGLTYVHYRNYYQFWNSRKINAIATFSRFPIVNSGFFMIRDRLCYAVYTDIVLSAGDTIRVFNLHLESIHFGAEDYRYMSKIGDPDMDQEQLTLGSKKMFWKLKNAFIKRGQQVGILREYISNSPYPVMVCGDFNDPPFSYTYRTIMRSRDLNDAYKAAGNELIGSTYSGKIPFFRIDYILFEKQFQASGYQMPRPEISDHYPVIVTLQR